MESYWEGWGFSDSIPVTINATPKKIDILKKELTKSFPNSPIEDLDSRNFIIYSSDEDLKRLKKFVTTLNGKAFYNLGGKTTGQLVYVLYSPTNQALEVLNKNGSTKNNWWKSNLDRKASDKLVDDLVAKRLMAGAIVYVGDPQYIRMKNGGNVGEAMASSNPYIGGAKAIQGIAPQSVSALDSKIASRISSDPNRPIFFNKGGLTPKEKLLKELQKLQRELNSSRLRTYYIDDYSENEIARKRERESKLKRFNEILEILNSMPNQMKRGGIAEQNKIRKVMHEFKEGELHSSSGQKVTDRKQAIAIALSEAGVSRYENGGGVGQTDFSVAQTILNQLGGMKRLVIMTGAYNFVASPNAVSFRIKNRKVNYIKITLNGKNLYDVKFSKIFNYQEKVVAELNDIYFDQLIPIFEQNTGMYLKMFKKGGMVSTQNRDMVISQLKTIHHHEQEMLETLKNSGEVEAWVLAKVSNASSDLSDIAHYLEFR